MEDYKAWIPKEYLAQYYATDDIAADERSIIKFIVRFFREKRLRFSKMLEIGCGPTIHHVLPFVPHVDSIYMADYIEANLAEIQKVLEETANAHDWSRYINGILQLEDASDTAERRICSFRDKTRKLLPCNVLLPYPIGDNAGTFPLVTSFYTLECISTDQQVWRQAMANVASLVANDGWLFLSAIYDAREYKVGEKIFPVTRITEDELRSALSQAGFIPGSIQTEIASCEWSEEGFDKIIVCCAQKSADV